MRDPFIEEVESEGRAPASDPFIEEIEVATTPQDDPFIEEVEGADTLAPVVESAAQTFKKGVAKAKQVNEFFGGWPARAMVIPQTIFEGLQIPSEAVAKTVDFATEIAKGPGTLGDVVDAAIDSDLLQEVRRRKGYKDTTLKGALGEAWDRPLMDAVPDIGVLLKNVLLPDVTVSEAMGGAPGNAVEGLVLKLAPTEKTAAKIAGGVADFATDVITDPFSWVGAPALGKAGKLLGEVRAPFTNKVLAKIESKAAAEAIDNTMSWLSAKTMGDSWFSPRSYLTRSGFAKDDAYQAAAQINRASSIEAMKMAREGLEFINASPEAHEAFRWIAEFGPEAGVAFAKKQGLKITPEILDESNRLLEYSKSINNLGNEAIVKAGGRDLSKIPAQPVSWQEIAEGRKELAERLKKSGEARVPPMIVSDGGTQFDLTFSTPIKTTYHGDIPFVTEIIDRPYDLGRALKPNVAELRAAEKSLDGYDAAIRSSGLNAKSSRHRQDYSTPVMDYIMQRELGIGEAAFQTSKADVVLQNLADKLQVADKLKEFNFIKNTFGTENPAEAITKAANRIEMSKTLGIPPSYDDLLLSKMDPSDFRSVDEKALNKIKPFIGADETVFLREKSLKYPSSIAARVEAKAMEPSRSKVAQFTEWFMREKGKNMLTAPLRIPKQFFDNSVKGMALGVSPADWMNEMSAMTTLSKGDDISRLATNIPVLNETIFTLSDFTKPVGVNPAIFKAEAKVGAYDDYLKSLHSAASEKKLDNALGLKKESNLKKLAELPNNNPISNSVRALANSSDVLLKRAYFRKLMRGGATPEQAVKRVGEVLMDFSQGSDKMKRLRYGMQFAAFRFKNLEALPYLIAANPGAANAMQPFNGHLKKAIERTSGWDTETYKMAQELFPYARDPIMGPVLRGQADVNSDPEDSVKSFFNEWIGWGLSEDQKKKLEKGYLLSFELPTAYSAATEMFDFKNHGSHLSSPLFQALVITGFGLDPNTGKPMVYEGSEEGLATRKRLIEAAQTMNPYDFKRLVFASQPAIEKMMGEYRERLSMNPILNDVSEIIGLKLGKGALDKMKVDDKTIRQMTDLKTLGMGRVDQADFNWLMHQNSLMKRINDLQKGLPAAIIRAGKPELANSIAAIQTLVEDLKENTKIFQDYKARLKAAGGDLPDELKAAMGATLQVNDDEPIEVQEEEFSEEEPGREPQSANDTLFTRASDLYSRFRAEQEKAAAVPGETVAETETVVEELPQSYADADLDETDDPVYSSEAALDNHEKYAEALNLFHDFDAAGTVISGGGKGADATEILAEVAKGKSPAEIAALFDVAEGLIRDFLASPEAWLETEEDAEDGREPQSLPMKSAPLSNPTEGGGGFSLAGSVAAGALGAQAMGPNDEKYRRMTEDQLMEMARAGDLDALDELERREPERQSAKAREAAKNSENEKIALARMGKAPIEIVGNGRYKNTVLTEQYGPTSIVNGVPEKWGPVKATYALDKEGNPILQLYGSNKGADARAFDKLAHPEDFEIEARFFKPTNGPLRYWDQIKKGTYNSSAALKKAIDKVSKEKIGYHDEISSSGGSVPDVVWTLVPKVKRLPKK